MSIRQLSIEKGAANLLVNCAGTRRDDHLLIIREEPGLGYYDEDIVTAVAEAGRRIGAHVTVQEVPFNPQATEVPAEVRTLMGGADRTVFLARIGDQLRFSDMASNGRALVSYALDAEMLGSAYGTADYRAFDLLKSALNRMLSAAKTIHVSCPAGTDFRGSGPGSVTPLQDVGIYRFPMPVFTPIPATGFSGRVALPGFLIGTGSMYYEPYAVEYDGALFADFANNRMTGFSGDKKAIEVAGAHYQLVAGKFGIDRDFVHSWHAGIHPACAFPGAASDNYERWSGAAFGNPRLLHFHTCGAYAPGEISWNVVDPTIVVDGVAVWKDGVLHPELVPGGADILAQYPCARAVFDAPSRNIGL
uniref:hypothetical protein n=1 Tax=Pararhizobium sp. IMCC3301 TaxID=3067904 RepID=UPI0027418B32|nr:hypothetical protein [Pararhizobium sp. IMCC3301]